MYQVINPNDARLEFNVPLALVEELLGLYLPPVPGFFALTAPIPDNHPDVLCGLHGPCMGDAPVKDDEADWRTLEGRPHALRVCKREPRFVRKLTMIGLAHPDKTVELFTSYGGPIAPKSPMDKTCSSSELMASHNFWAQHARSEG